MYCIETKNLSHRFSEKEVVLNNIELQVPEGSIYGFFRAKWSRENNDFETHFGFTQKARRKHFYFR